MDYFKLVQSFPLRSIRNPGEYEQGGPTALGKVLGTSHAMAPLMLHGKRGISAKAARALAEYFKVETGLFVRQIGKDTMLSAAAPETPTHTVDSSRVGPRLAR